MGVDITMQEGKGKIIRLPLLLVGCLALVGCMLLIIDQYTGDNSYPAVHSLSSYELKEGEALIHTGGSNHQVSTVSYARSLRTELVVGTHDPRWKTIFQRQREVGAEIQQELVFQDIKSLSYRLLVQPVLDRGKVPVMVIEFRDSYPNLWDIAGGKYDYYLRKFAKDVRNGKRTVWIRPMHEFNGDWYSWGTFRGGSNSKAAFKKAYQHVRSVFRAERAYNVKFQLAFNCEHPGERKDSFWGWFPGSSNFDMITCSCYNRAYSSQWHRKWESFEQVYRWGYWQMNALGGNKPLGVAEVSSVNRGGDKAKWIRDAFEALLWQFPRCQQVNWFLENKWDGPWDLQGDKENRAFGESVRKLRNLGLHRTLTSGTQTAADGALEPAA